MFFEYAECDYPVRGDLSDAYREAWRRLALPGSWWTGAERVAIAFESRNAFDCTLCRQRIDQNSTSPAHGEHDHSGQLPDAAIEVIHRVITGSGHINREWLDDILASGLSDGQYVEMLSVLVMVFSIDEFTRAVGAPLEALPDPGPGEPGAYRPSNLETETGFVPMIPADGNSGDEADLWPTGLTGNVVRAMSLVPDAVRDLALLGNVQYLTGDKIFAVDADTGRAIDRMQIELVASRASPRTRLIG